MCEVKNLCIKTFKQENEKKIDVQRIVRSNEEFGKVLFKTITNENSDNVIISPFSAHCALSMVYSGAEGETAELFQTAFDLSDAETTASQYHQLLSTISNISSVTFNAANKIYVAEKCVLVDYVQSMLEKEYFARAENVNFAHKEQSAKSINEWVAKQTNNKIQNLIKTEMIDEGTRLILVNAVYFKGDWLCKFPAAEKKPFYLLDGTTRDIDMMINEGFYNYTEDDTLNAQIVELPYKGEEISMFVFVPKEKTGIKDLENALPHCDWKKIHGNITDHKIDLWLPKFKIEFETSLKQALEKMGMSAIFSSKAQFTKMTCCKMDLRVDEIIQKAFIEVNEEGTEAAASTGIEMVPLSAFSPPTPTPILKADHPFMFTLNFKSLNNAPFFFGRIMELS